MAALLSGSGTRLPESGSSVTQAPAKSAATIVNRSAPVRRLIVPVPVRLIDVEARGRSLAGSLRLRTRHRRLVALSGTRSSSH